MNFKESDWNYVIDLEGIEESFFNNFDKCVKSINEDTLSLLKDGRKKTTKYDYNSNNNQNCDEELRRFIEKNKEIRQNIDLKLEDISRQQTQYENLKKDQKLLSQGIIDRHEAYLMAKKYYKKFLKMYCTTELKNSSAKQFIYVQFFTEFRKESENYSLRLTRDSESEVYQLLSVTPRLQIEKEIQRILQDTNDLPGLLCCIRQALISLRSQNKKEF